MFSAKVQGIPFLIDCVIFKINNNYWKIKEYKTQLLLKELEGT